MDETGSISFPDKPEQTARATREDGYYIAVMVILAFLGYKMSSLGIVGIGVAVVGALGYVQAADGRIWFLLFVLGPSEWWVNRVQKGYFYRASASRLTRALMRFRSPMEKDAIYVITEDLATKYNKGEDTDTVYIESEGSDSVMSYLATQLYHSEQTAQLVRRLSLVKGVEIGLAWGRSYRPSNIRETVSVFTKNLIPEVLPPDDETGTSETTGFVDFPEDWEVTVPTNGHGTNGVNDDTPDFVATSHKAFMRMDPQRQEGIRLVLPTLEELDGMSITDKDAICYYNASRNVEDQLEIVRDESQMTFTYLAITIKRDTNLAKLFVKPEKDGASRFWKRFRRRHKSMAAYQDDRLLVEEIVNVAVEGLELAGVDDPQPMNYRRVHELFRYGWDIQQDDKYAAWMATNPGLDDPRFETFHGPQDYVRASKGVLDMDGNKIAVIRATGAPRESYVFTFHELQTTNVVPNLTVSTVSRIIASDREVDLMEFTVAGRQALNEEAGVWYEKQSTQERRARQEHNLRQAYQAKFRVRKHMVYVILAKDERSLEGYVSDFSQLINGIDGMRVKRVKKSILLIHWFWAAISGSHC